MRKENGLKILQEIVLRREPMIIIGRLSRFFGPDDDVAVHRANELKCPFHRSCSNEAIKGNFNFSCQPCPQFEGKKFRSEEEIMRSQSAARARK